jgi:hypothetical protein
MDGIVRGVKFQVALVGYESAFVVLLATSIEIEWGNRKKVDRFIDG